MEAYVLFIQFFVFDDEVTIIHTKILRNLCLHFARQDEKENNPINVTKYQKPKWHERINNVGLNLFDVSWSMSKMTLRMTYL